MGILDTTLNEAKKNGYLTVIHLMNGYQIKGKVLEFDEETVLVEHKGNSQLICGQAIGTVYTIKPEVKEEKKEEKKTAKKKK